MKVKPPADLWEQVDALRASVIRKPPEGSFTVHEYSARYGMEVSSARRELCQLVFQGIMDSGDFSRSKGGKVRYYWPKKS